MYTYSIGPAVIVLLIVIGVFFLFRGVLLWYWKVNTIVTELKELKFIMGVIATRQAGKDKVDVNAVVELLKQYRHQDAGRSEQTSTGGPSFKEQVMYSLEQRGFHLDSGLERERFDKWFGSLDGNETSSSVLADRYEEFTRGK